MSKKEVESAVKELFSLKLQGSELKSKEKECQEVIDAYATENIDQFIDGQLSLENGLVKIMQNPPKMVFAGSQKPLTPSQRTEFCGDLPADYVDVKPNTIKIVARINGDKGLKSLLKAKDIEVIQESRFAAKAY